MIPLCMQGFLVLSNKTPKKQKALSGVSLGNTQSLSPHLLYLMFCSLMLVSPTESFTLYSEIYTVKHIYVYSGASHLSCLLIVLFELLQVFSGQKQDFFLSVITLSRECPSLFIHLPLLLNFLKTYRSFQVFPNVLRKVFISRVFLCQSSQGFPPTLTNSFLFF